MKRQLSKIILLLTLAIILLSGCEKENVAPQKPQSDYFDVIIEFFSNVQCSLCAEVACVMDSVQEYFDNHDDGKRPIIIEYHPAIPADDPFYRKNPEIQQARQSFYGVVGELPQVFLDGHQLDSAVFKNSEAIITEIKEQKLLTKPASIDIEYQLTQDSIIVSGTITADSSLQGQLYAMLTRRVAKFDEAPGISGQKEFHFVAVSIMPAEAGEFVAIRKNKTHNFRYFFPLPDEIIGCQTSSYTVLVIMQNMDKIVLAAKAIDISQ